MKPNKGFISALAGLLLLLLPLVSLADENSVLSKIAEANALYEKRQYQEAAGLYRDLIDQGIENGYLHYNLGNTYFRLGQLGPAILNYVKANRLIPRDESLRANLAYAIQKTPDQLNPPSTGVLSALFFWIEDFNQAEHLNALRIVNVLFWSALCVWFVRRTGFWDTARKTLMALFLISILSTGVKLYVHSQPTTGVILAKEIDVKSAKGTRNVTLFQLHEGAIVSILKKEDGWYRIELEDGKKGWAQKEFIGV